MIGFKSKLFKQIWSDRETAADFLANYLPKGISGLIDLKTLEICKDSFVDKNLKEYFSDLLYKVSLEGKTGYVYLLFEHKSYSKKATSLQLLSYICGFHPRAMNKNCLKYFHY
jgi:predicted transposase/invertase (TIGR01784 family)